MTTRFRRPMLMLGTTILIMQAVFMPVGMVYAETTMDTEEQELMELPPVKNYLEEEQISDPRFFFTRSRMQGTAEEPLQVTFFSDQEVSEARVFLPEEATLLKDQLPTGISVEEGVQPNEWIVQSKRAQNTFVLPLVVEQVGNYELLVEDVAATLEVGEGIDEKESQPANKSSIEAREKEIESNLISDEEEQTTESSTSETDTNEEEQTVRYSMSVSTWTQYAAAINNQNVTTINVMANISGNTSLNTINRNLTINGNGYTINSQWQQYNITGANRQITVRNATITGTLTGDTAQFRADSGSLNVHFIFSDIIFRGANRFLTPTTNNAFLTVIFDGGNSNFPNTNSANALFVNVQDFRITNQASVEVSGRSLTNNIAGASGDIVDAMILSVESGSSLTVIGSSANAFRANTINIDGKLHISSPSSVNGIATSATLPIKINLGESSQVTLERTEGGGSIINTDRGGELSITRGAQFDFIHQNNGPVISAGTNPTFVNIESDWLALWDRGLQNEEKASMVFSDIALQARGINSSEIISANNERFPRLYDPAGLASYSRMSNREVEEIDRFVTAHYESEDGVTLKFPETLSGFLGDPYQSLPKQIPGYQLTVLPENASGEFTRETIQVTYVYQQTSVAPVDPLDPEVEVDPENKPELPEDQSQLSIDFVSSFDFGSQAISVHDETYYAQPQRLLNEDGTVNELEERPNYVQISDRRSGNDRNGWQLAVTQREQFKNQKEKQLVGASLSLSNQQLVTAQGGETPSLQAVNPLTLVPGNKRTLIRAEGTEGTGTWIYRFGDGETASESIALDVPKNATPDATAYSTTLIWELSAVPGNTTDE